MSYVYAPLADPSNCIRVLHLAPGIVGTSIECSLEIVTLKSKPKYDALSYVWGPPIFCKAISVDGGLLHITESLYVALQHLRDAKDHRTVWADAICINQKDIGERNAQVQLMRTVYSEASLVAVWLGEKNSEIDLAYDRLERWHVEGLPEDLAQEEISGLKQIFEKPQWWSRLWVIQEIICAQAAVLQFGDRLLPWEVIDEFVRQVSHQSTSAKIQLYNIMLNTAVLRVYRGMYQSSLKIGKRRNISAIEEHIAFLASLKGCADKRDVIYVMLNIVDPEESEVRIIPDYDKSVYDVFMELTRALLSYNKNLNLLCNTYYIFPKIDEYGSHQISPSWTIDWSRPRCNGVLFFPGRENVDVVYHASGESKVDKSIFDQTNSSLLVLSGVIYENVVSVSVDFNDGEPELWQPLVRSWRPEDLDQIPYPTSENPHDAYIRTLFRDTPTYYGDGRISEPQLAVLKELFTSWSTGCHDATFNISHKTPLEEVKSMPDFTELLWRNTKNWVLSTTSRGYFGLAQSGTQVGDTVAIIKGAPTPLILRPASSEAREALAPERTGKLWTRVSSAYVHGIMDGEVMEMVERGECAMEEILLI